MENKKIAPIIFFTLDCMSLILFTGILFILITFYFNNIVKVNGESMSPTYKNHEILVMDTNISEINRFDVISFISFDGTTYIKRVIGLPGEKIKISNDIIYINGQPLNDPYNTIPFNKYGIASTELTIPEDSYFVLGDNRSNSYDSRFEEVGFIKSKYILNKIKAH